MPSRGPRVPAYRLHKPTGQARVILDGAHIYLGKYGTAESEQKYRRVVAEWLASKSCPTRPAIASAAPPAEISVNELVLAFLKYADSRYVKNGTPTSEVKSFRTALRPLSELYGLEPVGKFGPLALVVCRQQLIDQGICRKRNNQHVTRIRQMFKWGVSRELVAETTWSALCSLEGLDYGEALETDPIKPVPEEHIPVIQPFVTPQVWAMVNFQIWTGCRPGEACLIRGIDLKMTGDIWEFRPHTHKGEHHRRERVIFLGPHAQEIIKPWLKTDLQA